jgi:hypothetical protein
MLLKQKDASHGGKFKPNRLVILAVACGLLAVLHEFRNIDQQTVFRLEKLQLIPLLALCVLTALLLYKNVVQLKHDKQFRAFIPALICIALIAAIFWHRQWRSSVDNTPVLFKAFNYRPGNDGGFLLEFKQNKYLKGQKMDHWAVTYYWGHYEQNGDTLTLDIHLDFNLGKHAILHNDVLSFTDDSVRFQVTRPYTQSE